MSARAQTVTPTLARGLGLSQDYGVILCDVVPGGPAARAGLEIGDIVLGLDRRPMENARQLEVNLYRKAVGETVTLEVSRRGATFTALVPIIERLEDPDRFAGLVTPERNLIPRLGVLGIEIDADLLRLLPALRGKDGVVVAVNGVSVRGLTELRQAVNALKKGDALVLQVERDGQLRFVGMEVD
jgi:S1-C subfamily serine protease